MSAVDAGRILGRGIAFPPRVGADGRVEWSEGETNIRQAIEVVLRTERRERLRLPEFGGGLAGFLFEPNTASVRHQLAERVRRALDAWEPRISVQSVDVVEDPAARDGALVTVLYKLVATQATERVSLSVPLGG